MSTTLSLSAPRTPSKTRKNEKMYILILLTKMKCLSRGFGSCLYTREEISYQFLDAKISL